MVDLIALTSTDFLVAMFIIAVIKGPYLVYPKDFCKLNKWWCNCL